MYPEPPICGGHEEPLHHPSQKNESIGEKYKQACRVEKGSRSVGTVTGSGSSAQGRGKAMLSTGPLEQQPSRRSAEFCKCLLLLR